MLRYWHFFKHNKYFISFITYYQGFGNVTSLNTIKQTISSWIGLNWHWVFGIDWYLYIFYPYLNSVMENIAIKEEDLTLLWKNVGNIYLNRDFHVVSVNTLRLHIRNNNFVTFITLLKTPLDRNIIWNLLLLITCSIWIQFCKCLNFYLCLLI